MSKTLKTKKTHKCLKCNKFFRQKCHLDAHEKNKKSCIVIINKNKRKCPYPECKCSYTQKSSLNRHVKEKHSDKVVDDNVNISIEKKFILFRHGRPEISHFNSQDALRILSTSEPIFTIIQETNLNPLTPQYHNIGYKNNKNAVGIIYNGKKWITEDINSIIHTLLFTKYLDLCALADILEKKLSDEKSTEKSSDEESSDEKSSDEKSTEELFNEKLSDEKIKNIRDGLYNILKTINPVGARAAKSYKILVRNIRNILYNNRELAILSIKNSSIANILSKSDKNPLEFKKSPIPNIPNILSESDKKTLELKKNVALEVLTYVNIDENNRKEITERIKRANSLVKINSISSIVLRLISSTIIPC